MHSNLYVDLKNVTQCESDYLYEDIKDLVDSRNDAVIGRIDRHERNGLNKTELNQTVESCVKNYSDNTLTMIQKSHNETTMSVNDNVREVGNTIIGVVNSLKNDLNQLNRIKVNSNNLNDKQNEIIKKMGRNCFDVSQRVLKLKELNNKIIDILNKGFEVNSIVEASVLKAMNDKLPIIIEPMLRDMIPRILEESLKPILQETIEQSVKQTVQPMFDKMMKRSYNLQLLPVFDDDVQETTPPPLTSNPFSSNNTLEYSTPSVRDVPKPSFFDNTTCSTAVNHRLERKEKLQHP